MNRHVKKSFHPEAPRRERKQRLQMFAVIVLSLITVCILVVMGMHHVRQLPARPPSLFN